MTPHAQPQCFDLSAFAEPDTRFWPSYFWIWNDRLEADEVVRQLRDMHRHGVRGACVVPEPPEFRPELMATALEPEYLSAAYFDVVRLAVGECARLGTSFWLYDEGGWPSGSTCGRVVAARPDLANCRLVLLPLPVPESERGRVVATAWGGDDHRQCLAGYLAAVEGEANAAAYTEVRQQTRDSGHPVTPDLLDPRASATFIALTHERYAAAVGRQMGSGLPLDRAFTDEPAVPPVVTAQQIPWTRGFLDLFRAAKGYDLLPHLPVLFADPSQLSREQMLVRLDYFDVWSQRLVDAYLEPIRAWCHDHGLLSAGHFGGEDEIEGSVAHGFGHLLRSLRALDVPGVDAIWRQLFPGGRAHHFPKYASSVARQAGSVAMSESFAVYGNGLTPAQMKWLVDFQWVRGIGCLVGACYPYSTRHHFMFGERPHIGPVNPLWDGLADFHAYTARLSYALSAGQALVQAAVYFPVRDVWTGLASRSGAVAAHDALAQALLSAQRDFDYVDDDVLQASPTSAGTLVVGPMRYHTLLLSQADWLPEATVRAIERFVRAGGRLVCCAARPRCDGSRDLLAMLGLEGLRPGESAPLGEGSVSLAAMAGAVAGLAPVVSVAPGCSALRACSRESGSGRLYFLINEGSEAINVTARFPEPGAPLVLDAITGTARPCRECSIAAGQAEVPLRLAAYESLLLWFPNGAAPSAPQRYHTTEALTLGPDLPWTLRPLRRHSMGEHDFVIEDLAAAEPRPTRLGDWQPVLGEGFSGQAEYSLSFSWDGDTAGEFELDLTDVCYVADVWLNDAYLGRRLWQPYRFAAGDHLMAGENRLRVVVTNTLANALVGEHGERVLAAGGGPGWPGPYDARAREFERQSLRSGLFGPVWLLRGRWLPSA
ncbi:MAG: glycosyl hydrolase [Anaerolineae bacterium]